MRGRLTTTKILIILTIPLMLFGEHVYEDDSFVDLALELSGYLLLVISALGRIWASAFLSGMKNKVLITNGPYSLVRNPLYFFSFIGFIGAGFAFESVTLAVLLGIAFFSTHWKTILKEEGELHQLFGESFEAYCKGVPRFIPKLSGFKSPEELQFKPVKFTHAVAECALIFTVFVGAHIIEWAHAYFQLPTLIRFY